MLPLSPAAAGPAPPPPPLPLPGDGDALTDGCTTSGTARRSSRSPATEPWRPSSVTLATLARAGRNRAQTAAEAGDVNETPVPFPPACAALPKSATMSCRAWATRTVSTMSPATEPAPSPPTLKPAPGIAEPVLVPFPPPPGAAPDGDDDRARQKEKASTVDDVFASYSAEDVVEDRSDGSTPAPTARMVASSANAVWLARRTARSPGIERDTDTVATHGPPGAAAAAPEADGDGDGVRERLGVLVAVGDSEGDGVWLDDTPAATSIVDADALGDKVVEGVEDDEGTAGAGVPLALASSAPRSMFTPHTSGVPMTKE
jgi:hypothetical protein